MEGVDSKAQSSTTSIVTGVQCASGPSSVSNGHVQIEPATLRSIVSGQVKVDLGCCRERVAVKCPACKQQLLVRSATGNGLRMSN
jgi:hypothetical protein